MPPDLMLYSAPEDQFGMYELGQSIIELLFGNRCDHCDQFMRLSCPDQATRVDTP
jgi:hypothetical protein